MNTPGKSQKKSRKKEHADENTLIAERKKDTERFPVVGIGASAGGLEAIIELFSRTPVKCGLAFIVHTHMAPNQPSMIPELLQRKTDLPVSTAKDGDALLKDHIYIIPPGKEISLFKGTIQLFDATATNRFLPIDFFLRSLAKDQKSNAVAIILSGTGTDGTLGIKEVKLHEGLVMVQSEESSKYDGMPRSAIKTGVVDLILPPAEMTRKIIHYFSHTPDLKIEEPQFEPDRESWLPKVFALLRLQIGHDFSNYKKSTILRRISRRMNLNQIEDHDLYIRFMKENPGETEALFRELLIGVTSFFRDRDSFEVLQQDVLKDILSNMADDSTFRVWIPGCSTGEEAYSIAIVLKESLDRVPRRINLQMFGTDIDKYAIEKAREGLFPSSIAADVSDNRLKRFFIQEGEFYRIRKEIRDSVVFSTQDILQDPPFARLNLLCCRNLLIYLDSAAQNRLLPLFHYTLLPEGILVLGTSETIGEHIRLFKTINSKWKIFQRQEVPKGVLHSVQFPTGSFNHTERYKGDQPIPLNRRSDIGRLVQKIILEQVSPTSILIDKDGTMLHVQGRTGKFLEQVSGRPSDNIVDMAREGLQIELSSAIRSAVTSKQSVIRNNIQVKTNGDTHPINLHVRPLFSPRELSGYLLVIFEEMPVANRGDGSEQGIDGNKEIDRIMRIRDLEQELQSTREGYQTTLEELESSNEELKSINEEMQSANEELQSTNEELESSKEELQSLNEELQTVNSELQCKLDELSSTQDDMRNLLNSTEIATIFVDNQIRIKRFTEEAVKIINLIQTDIGRPLEHLVNNLKYDGMIVDVKEVLARLIPKEVEVMTTDEELFRMRIMPYRTIDNRIDGAVLTFFNINRNGHSGVLAPGHNQA